MSTKLLSKTLIVGAMTLILMVALFMINGVVDDRQRFRDDAVHSIEASYAGPQTLVGPVLVQPYTQVTQDITIDSKGIKTTIENKQELAAISFPRTLKLDGSMLPSERRHGLYKVEVYELDGRMQGRIEPATPKVDGKVTWGEPYLALSVTDVRGLVATPHILVNGVPATMLQGAPISSAWQPNLRIPLSVTPGANAQLKTTIDFDISLKLAGTGTLAVAPVADSNQVQLSSSWRSPLFAGQFLPQTPQISDAGFHAHWDVPSLATGTQMQLLARTDKTDKPVDVISVSLTNLIDPYTLSSRAVKYGILFILLTFGGFFLFELGRQLPIHPVQYMLVGLELAVFFLLLVSFSEHIAFGRAYLLASAASIGLLTFYLSYVLRSMQRALAFGAMLTTLYAAVYGLLVSEDNALVLGALLMFLLLAVVMVLTRKVDWYRGAAAAADTIPPPPPLPAQL